MSEIDAFYTECMNCSKTIEQCPGTWKDIPAGVPPRGFRDGRKRIDILVVAKNPGHPLIGEQDTLKGLSGRDLLTAYRGFQETHRQSGPAGASGRFHRNLLRYLEYFLDLSGPDLTKRVARTNLVKCSSPDERAPLKARTMEECYATFLLREIRLLNPKVILALGNEVRNFLLRRQREHGIEVIGIKHPSYFYRREVEGEILTEIKAKIQSALSCSAQQSVQRDGFAAR